MAEEKQRPSLIQRVETIASVIELLLETLAGLSDGELRKFKTVLSQSHLHRCSYRSMQLRTADMQDTVFLMVQNDGQLSVEMTTEVLEKMKRTDLVQRLSQSSSGPKKKHSVDEHLSALIHKVSTMRAVKELLLETLSDLSYEELEKFKWLLQFMFFQRSLKLIPGSELSFPNSSWRQQQWIDCVNQLVDVMLERCGQRSVEVTKEVLMDMNRTDLVQRLSETSSGHKEKHRVDEHCPALIQKVETMTSIIELLLETLAGLSDGGLEEFRDILLSQTDLYRRLSDMTQILLEIEDRQNTVFLMVLTDGQQSVETTQEVLRKMKRINLVWKLLDSSKGPKKKHSDEHRPALIQKVATMAAVKQLLLETLNGLSDKDFKKFKLSLKWTVSQKNLPNISPELSYTRDRERIVDVMLQTYSQQSVQLTREAVKKMNRTDPMQRLSKPSSELKEKHSVDEHQPAVLKRAAVKRILLETLKDLSYKELEKIKWLLRFTQFQKGLPHISLSRLLQADSAETLVNLMLQTCGQQSVKVTKEVFMDMNRTDLVKKLSVISSRITEKHPSELLQQRQDPSGWTKVEPEVTSTDANKASTYSLQSEAGNFECSVSGLRWVCKEKVSFKYQFSSLSGHFERIESMKYMPAGPLMDITVTAGKLDVVYLPHWICIDDNPTILDKFAVLHIDDCGNVVEKVSEVTSSHVKLSEPDFSLLLVGLLDWLGLPVEIYCMVLIYSKVFTASFQTSLTLHVYLLPSDLGLQEELDSREKSYGFNGIPKSKPEKSLKTQNWFTLTTDQDGAEIYPEGEKPQALKLRYNSTGPNFYEVIVQNPDKDFKLMLTPENGHQPVWTCKIRKGEWQSTGHVQEKHSVDKHQEAAIAADRKRLFKMLIELTDKEFKDFKFHLLRIPESQRENTDRVDLVKLMLQTYTQESVQVAKDILKEIPRNDLVQLLSDTSSGSEAAGSSA